MEVKTWWTTTNLKSQNTKLKKIKFSVHELTTFTAFSERRKAAKCYPISLFDYPVKYSKIYFSLNNLIPNNNKYLFLHHQPLCSLLGNLIKWNGSDKRLTSAANFAHLRRTFTFCSTSTIYFALPSITFDTGLFSYQSFGTAQVVLCVIVFFVHWFIFLWSDVKLFYLIGASWPIW